MLCQSCGRPLAPGTQFCGECGAQVGAVATTPGAVPPPPPPTAADAPTSPQPVVGEAVLPPSPPLSDVYGSPPAPPPGGGVDYGAAPAPGAPGGGSKRTVILLSVLGALVVVALLGVGFALARSGADSIQVEELRGKSFRDYVRQKQMELKEK